MSNRRSSNDARAAVVTLRLPVFLQAVAALAATTGCGRAEPQLPTTAVHIPVPSALPSATVRPRVARPEPEAAEADPAEEEPSGRSEPENE